MTKYPKYSPSPVSSGNRATQRDQAGPRLRVLAAADTPYGSRFDLLPGRIGQPEEVVAHGGGRDGGIGRRRQGPEPAADAALRHWYAPRGAHRARQEDRRGVVRQSEDTGQS